MFGTWSGELGFSPESFWDQTPRTLAAIMTGKSRALRWEHNELAWTAWHTAALTRAKKMPRLNELLDTPKREPRKQSPEEMEAALRSWFVRK